jgi:hypothetical protein
MASITLTISTDNAAFEEDASGEVARILRKFAERLDEQAMPEPGETGRLPLDINGNTVGSWTVTA